jgi:hypothetical protein
MEGQMRFIAGGFAAALLLGGCGTPGPTLETLNAAEKRELTPIEKVTLASSLAQTLKDPGAAQFKWMPVTMLQREAVTDYCGLVNGRNSYGGYTGYQKFYAQLFKDGKGQFTKGLIRLIASGDVETMATDGQCEKYGYVDFSLAK